MAEERFRFKKFEVSHGKSSMKVGIDAVLLGAWCDPSGESALDVGTGCGVIALIIAQRNPEMTIHAIEPDHDSAEEAKMNFKSSEWEIRLKCKEITLAQLLATGQKECYDNIVSNPPFFNSGVKEVDSARLRARHQKSLSLKNLIEGSSQLLKPGGRLSFIFPTSLLDEVKKAVYSDLNLRIKRICNVEMRSGDSPKRTMIEIIKANMKDFEEDLTNKKENSETEISLLRLFDEKREPTEEYKTLCKDFYLKF